MFDKSCEVCGAPIPWGHDSITQHMARRFCSQSCSGASHRGADDTPHYCRHCHRQLVRKAGEPYTKWRGRKFCDNTCRAGGQVLCECGARITQTVWVVQLSPSGDPYAAPLRLCDTCAAMVPEGTSEPAVLTGNERGWRQPVRVRLAAGEFEDEAWHQVHVASGWRMR